MVFRRLATALILGLVAVGSPSVAQNAGTLISAEPVTDTPDGMQAWRVGYWTRNEENRPVRATAMIAAPREAQPRAERKVVTWAHGTAGVTEACGLSDKPGFFDFTPGLRQLVTAGYVVAAPDYIGLGNPGPHAYLSGRETAHAVLDAVRAARAIPGAYAGRDFIVWGESQGGHAALWTASTARSYARELKLVGTAAAAPPTELLENLRQASDDNARAFLTALLAYSWSKRFDAPLDKLFGRLNRGVANSLAQRCISRDADLKLGTLLGILSIRNALRGKDLGKIDRWGALARKNSVRAGSVAGPVFIAQAESDPLVAPAVTRDFARDLCRRGRAVRYVSLPGGDHARSAFDSADATLAWIADRFAGRQSVSDCGRI